MQLIESLALGKAAGPDGFMAEFLVYGRKALAPILALFFSKLMNMGSIPDEWKEALIVPVYKNKGSDKEIANYRPIALTVITRRLYERLILKQLNKFVGLLENTQGGFRANRSTLDQCFVLNEIQQINPKAIHAFLDIKAAFDTVNRKILWSNLANDYGIPVHLVNRLQDLFDDNKSFLVINGQKSVGIQNRRGLLQGSS